MNAWNSLITATSMPHAMTLWEALSATVWKDSVEMEYNVKVIINLSKRLFILYTTDFY